MSSHPLSAFDVSAVDSGGTQMAQTLAVVLLFVAVIAMLPWLIRQIQQRHTGATNQSTAASKVVSAVAVGPHQRVVTVEVGPENARTCLVLGVTAQQIHCLHIIPTLTPTPSSSGANFAQAMEQAMPSAALQAKEPLHG